MPARGVMLHRLSISVLMAERGIKTFKALAKRAGIDYRTMMRAVNGESFISLATAKKLMDALGAHSLKSLGARDRRLALAARSEHVESMLPTDICCRAELQKALDADLAGDSETAVHIGLGVLADIPPDDVRSYLVAAAKVISFYTNCGDYSEAWKLYESVERRLRRKTLRPWLTTDEWQWCRYHAGVTLRRDGSLDAATTMFSELSHLPRYHLGATHQLAAIDIAAARHARDPGLIKEKLAEAEQKLAHCRDAWEKTWDHRLGFTFRRAADAKCLMAELEHRDANLTAANDLLIEALHVFSSHKLQRYIDATKASLRVLFEIKGKALAPMPEMVPDPPRRRERIVATDVASDDGRSSSRLPLARRRPSRPKRKRGGTDASGGDGLGSDATAPA